MNKTEKIYTLLLIITACSLASCEECCNCNDKEEIKELILQPNAEEGIDAIIENYPLDGYADRNFGTHEALQAAAWTDRSIEYVTRGLIDFNFSEIAVNGTISSVKLVLHPAEDTPYGTGHSNRSGSNAFVIQRVTSEWDELSVTWNNQPSTTTDREVYVDENADEMLIYEIDITGLVNDIINNQSQSFGLMLKLVNEEYYRRVLFASSDYEDVSKHPKLVVEYD